MAKVNIGKPVDYKTLEGALLEAAALEGWRSYIGGEDELIFNFDSDDSISTQARKAQREYSHTEIVLYRKGEELRVEVPNKTSTDYFKVRFITLRSIEGRDQYIEAVRARLCGYGDA